MNADRVPRILLCIDIESTAVSPKTTARVVYDGAYSVIEYSEGTDAMGQLKFKEVQFPVYANDNRVNPSMVLHKVLDALCSHIEEHK